MFLAGLNLPGADLTANGWPVRAEYMDVFCNPVTEDTGCLPPQARRGYFGQRCFTVAQT
jgi:hypothetical protein